MAQSGCVDESVQHSVDVHNVLYHIARRALNVADDGFLLAYKGIEQCGFAGVGLAHYRHRNTLLYGIAHAEAARKRRNFILYLMRKLLELSAVGELEVLVIGEVELQLHKRSEL